MTRKELTPEQSEKINHFVELVNRVNESDHTREEAKELETFFDNAPLASLLIGDVVQLNRENLIGKTINGKASQIALKTRMKVMQTELGYQASPYLEKVVIDNVLDSWLYLQHAQHNLNSWLKEPGTGYDAAEYWEKRMNSAQRRFLRASSTLARIRKMDLPPIQVNIAQQQVNQVKT